jgi:hypothetical protein
MDTLSVVTWNMNQRPGSWEHLARLRDKYGVQVALVQEAVPPVMAGWLVHPAAETPDAWRVVAHSNRERKFASAVVLLDKALTMAAVEPQALGQAEYGQFAVSHPGQFAVAEIGLPSGAKATMVSLYGVWDRDERWLFWLSCWFRGSIHAA